MRHYRDVSRRLTPLDLKIVLAAGAATSRSTVGRRSRREPHNRTAAYDPTLAKSPRAHASPVVADGVLR